MATGKIQRVIVDGKVRLHEAVSDSVYVRGTETASEGTLTEVLDELAESTPTPRRVSLLHISDNHHKNTLDISYAWGVAKLKDVLINDTLNEIALALHTGDMGSLVAPISSNVVLEKMVASLSSWNAQHPNKPILLVKGNHDATDSVYYEYNTSRYADANRGELEVESTKHYSRAINGDGANSLVEWGEDQQVTWADSSVTTEKMGYWYKDVEQSGVKFRIIAVDEYQTTVGSNNTSMYHKIYSQAQIDWLIDTLKSTPSDAYIILAHHQAVYDYHPENVVNNFTHHGIYNEVYYTDPKTGATKVYDGSLYTYGVEVDVTVNIIDAYQHHRRWTNAAYPSGAQGVTLDIDADFRDTVPAKFAFHIGGHTHGDFCEFVPGYPLQLSLIVMSDNPRTESSGYEPYSDVVRVATAGNVASYAFNKVTIDADRDVVRVERIGANTLKTASNIYDDGTKRTFIEFPIRTAIDEERDYYTKDEIDALLEALQN